DKAFSEIHRVLSPQSEAVLSLMCHGSFAELDAAWQCLDQSKHTNEFLSHQHIVNAAESAGFTVS
ncbi:MAG: SAM-dependent methyltransferase, partial [Pseudomonadota bacterium]